MHLTVLVSHWDFIATLYWNRHRAFYGLFILQDEFIRFCKDSLTLKKELQFSCCFILGEAFCCYSAHLESSKLPKGPCDLMANNKALIWWKITNLRAFLGDLSYIQICSFSFFNTVHVKSSSRKGFWPKTKLPITFSTLLPYCIIQ